MLNCQTLHNMNDMQYSKLVQFGAWLIYFDVHDFIKSEQEFGFYLFFLL